jgi:hypothetical protein
LTTSLFFSVTATGLGFISFFTGAGEDSIDFTSALGFLFMV